MSDTVTYAKKKKSINGQAGRNGSKSSSLLWNYALEGDQLNGHQFIRKFRVEEHKIDFVCRELKLAIEVIQNSNISTGLRTDEKHLFLEKQGYKILKYTDSEITSRIDDVVSDIFYIAENLADYYRNSTGPVNLIDN